MSVAQIPLILFHLVALAVGIAIDRGVGYPAPLYRRIGHPVTWIGRLIAVCDRRLNRPGAGGGARRAAGTATLVLVVGLTVALGIAIERVLPRDVVGLIVLAVLQASLIAGRSLDEHIRAVADALDSGGIVAGRAAVARVVGRDTAMLDVAGVARAAIESLAENFSDGVVAPVFWGAVAGLPGSLGYKAANTLDSMIGHRNARYLDFGRASARFDDLVNLPASRLAGLLLLVAAAPLPGGSPAGAWQAMLRDAGRHKSPNAGWPEAAMAGALGLKLAGPRSYGGERVDDAYMGDGRADLGPADIRRALDLFRIANAIVLALVVLAGAVVAITMQGG